MRSNPKAESYCCPSGEALYLIECRKALCKLPWFRDVWWFQKELYWELVEGSVLDPLEKRISFSQKVIRTHWNYRFGLLEQLRVHDHLAACTECIIPCELVFQSRCGRFASLLPQQHGWVRLLLLLRAGQPAFESRRWVDSSTLVPNC